MTSVMFYTAMDLNSLFFVSCSQKSGDQTYDIPCPVSYSDLSIVNFRLGYVISRYKSWILSFGGRYRPTSVVPRERSEGAMDTDPITKKYRIYYLVSFWAEVRLIVPYHSMLPLTP